MRYSGDRVRQRHCCYLGEINSSQERAWCKSVEGFDERTAQSRSLSLFAEDRIDEGVVDESVVHLCLSQLRLSRPRVWGSCWLTLKLWEILELDRFWRARLAKSRSGATTSNSRRSEEAFKNLRGDPAIRTIYHQLEQRVEAHISSLSGIACTSR